MSEHIQSAPTVADSRSESEHAHRGIAHPSTPGVSHESEAFNFRLILWVAIGLAAVGLGVHIGVGLLLGGLEERNAKPPATVSELALEDAKQSLGRRVDVMPGPHLEGIERESSILVIRTEEGDEKRFLTSANLHVLIVGKEKARLFDLREGQRVTLAYYMPGGVGGGLGIVTSVTSPPVESGKKEANSELPDVTRTLNGEILKIEPRGIAEARQWAEARRERYGWIDRDKEIVHIPVEKALEQVLRSKEFDRAKQSREPKRLEEGKR